jgi:2-hydroxymuconate-semialdehyde hydrolase
MISVAARVIRHGGFETAYIAAGADDGVAVVPIHGSGPGVSAEANWRLLLESPLAAQRRIIAPDVVGFGGSSGPGEVLDHEIRVRQLLDLLDALELPQVDVIGNSMGGGLALALAHRAPRRVRSMVLMGSVGVPFALTDGLAKVWGYRPSLDAMSELMTLFAFNQALVSEGLVRLRYEASTRPRTRAWYEAAFTEPLQQHIDAMALTDAELAAITVPALLIHGAEDKVVPLQTSLHLVGVLPRADLVVFGRCGHWTQIERSADFSRLVQEFFERVEAG